MIKFFDGLIVGFDGIHGLFRRASLAAALASRRAFSSADISAPEEEVAFPPEEELGCEGALGFRPSPVSAA